MKRYLAVLSVCLVLFVAASSGFACDHFGSNAFGASAFGYYSPYATGYYPATYSTYGAPTALAYGPPPPQFFFVRGFGRPHHFHHNNFHANNFHAQQFRNTPFRPFVGPVPRRF